VTTAATTPPSASRNGAGAAALTLAPVGLDAFLEDHWDRRPLLVQRDEPGRFDAVISQAELERIVCTGGIRTPAFRLVRDGVQLPLSTYTQDIPWRPGSFSGTAVVGRIAEEFASGATIVLQALHFSHHATALYCRGLEMALGCPVQANAYWTPASAQGFAVHHDTHDVFVIQVSGRKRWRVYEPVLELPAKDQRWSTDLGEVGEPIMDFVLGPGDTLYLPRGWPHEAETSDEASLHVTVGLHPPTRLDALRGALEACADDVEFRRALDADGALPGDLLARLADRLEPDQVAARARRRFVDGRRPIADGQLRHVTGAGELTASTPVERRPTVIADLHGTTLSFEGRHVAFPPHALDALEAAHAADGPFTAADLPGPLDEAGHLVLVRRLIREGYLRPA
jgi:ribosomal protein L16 Arg81 hydroxylase